MVWLYRSPATAENIIGISPIADVDARVLATRH